MCTLTWRAAREGGYDLFFNRDELDTRGIESPPRRERSGGADFAAPRDGDRGGTWILVNSRGLTVALLNDYAVRRRTPAHVAGVSRGALVLACAASATPREATGVVKGMDLGRAAAFRMVMVGADARAHRLAWDGVEMTEGDGEGLAFETSSSFATAEVCAARRRAYEALLAGRPQAERSELDAFHWRHEQGNGAVSTLMRRPGARTRSVTRVEVRAGRVEMWYWPVGEDARPAGSGGGAVKFARS